MKKNFSLTIAFILTLNCVLGQVLQTKDTSEIKVRGNPIYFIDGVKINSDSVDNIKSQSQEKAIRLVLYTWGREKPCVYNNYYDCEKSVSQKYGFKKQAKLSCVISYSQERRWKRHNRIVQIKLRILNGRNWRKKYEADLIQCLKK